MKHLERWWLLALVSQLYFAMMVGAEDAYSPPRVPVEAQFRGCDAAGSCRFWIAPTDAAENPLHRVRPDGVVRAVEGDAISIAVRNRLNQLLSSMIHQNKHIVLHAVRKLDDGTFAATVIVNDADVAADPILVELRERRASSVR
jgi:hypothetical protein